MIKVVGLRKKFGYVIALDGIDFSLEKGEFLTIFGPNGAGKSTLLRCLATIITPTSGEVFINGISLAGDDLDLVRSKIGMVSHYPFLYDNLTAYENLKFYSHMYGVNPYKARVEEVLNLVGLYGRKDDVVSVYSRGMQQRLSIARALLHDPSVVFLDEPYTGLDQHAAQILSGVLRHLYDSKRTVVMVTHNIEEGLAKCDRVAVQVQGRFVALESTKNIDKKHFSKMYTDLVGKSD